MPAPQIRQIKSQPGFPALRPSTPSAAPMRAANASGKCALA